MSSMEGSIEGRDSNHESSIESRDDSNHENSIESRDSNHEDSNHEDTSGSNSETDISTETDEDDFQSSTSVETKYENKEDVEGSPPGGEDYMNSDEEYPDSNVEETIPDESFEFGGSDYMDSGSYEYHESNEEGTDYTDDDVEEYKDEAAEETKPPVVEAGYARKTFHQSHMMPKHMLSELKNGGVSSHMTVKEHCTTEKQCPRIQFFCDGG